MKTTWFYKISQFYIESQALEFKFSPIWSCVELLRRTSLSGWKQLIILFNLRPNICKSNCLNTHFVHINITWSDNKTYWKAASQAQHFKG